MKRKCIICFAEGKIVEATRDYYGYDLCEKHYREVVEEDLDPEALEEYVIKAWRIIECLENSNS